MSLEKKLTPQQFAEDYAARSNADLQILIEANYAVCSCDCEWPTCKGWVMESGKYLQNCVGDGIPLPDEVYYLKDMEGV